MSNPKRQHWVPQFYLRHFAIPETAGTGRERVWAFSRNKRDSILPREFAVKDAAVEKFLYSPKLDGGVRDFQMERRLGDLESTLAELWPVLSTELLDLTKDVRRITALFLATLYLRHPARRSEQKALHSELAQGLEPLITSGVTGASRFDRAEFEEWKNATEEDHHSWFVSFLGSEASFLAKILLRKRWTVIVAPEPVFATSDEPVVLESPPGFGDRRPGFGTPGATVWFPICPTRILRLDDEAGANGRYCPLKQSSMPFRSCAMFNHKMWVCAYRFLYSSRPSDQILREVVEYVDFLDRRLR